MLRPRRVRSGRIIATWMSVSLVWTFRSSPIRRIGPDLFDPWYERSESGQQTPCTFGVMDVGLSHIDGERDA